MAIYSLHHSSIGKSTQNQPFTAGAHVSYITRRSALSRSDAGRCPVDAGRAVSFLRQAEDKLRKNGRVADKLMLALPRELTTDQRAALVRAFAEDVTDGRASWFAATHEKGKDAQNPHCHLLICDRDVKTGRRVFGMSEKGSTERLRRLWEDHANAALQRADREERIDRRTLEAQGVRRSPTIHVGVRSRQLVRMNRRIASTARNVRNHCQAQTRMRTVRYPDLDGGRLRLERNIEIKRQNLFASRGEGREEEYWAAISEEAFLREIRELRRLHATLEYNPDGRDVIRLRDERTKDFGLDP